MLARGFFANGAHVLLIDVNEEALNSTKADLESLSSSPDLKSKSITVSVYPCPTPHFHLY